MNPLRHGLRANAKARVAAHELTELLLNVGEPLVRSTSQARFEDRLLAMGPVRMAELADFADRFHSRLRECITSRLAAEAEEKQEGGAA